MKADAKVIEDGPAEEVARSVVNLPYLDNFKQWALARAKSEGLKTGAYLDSENLREWDRKYNYSRIKRSFGSDEDIREAGIRVLYSRVIGHYLKLGGFVTPNGTVSASPDYKLDVSMRAAIDGIHIAGMPEEERELLIQHQEDVIRRATKRLIYYRMPLERLNLLFRALEEEAAR